MIRTFSLQAKPEERDRSFYAFAEHGPPPIYAPQPIVSPQKHVQASAQTSILDDPGRKGRQIRPPQPSTHLNESNKSIVNEIQDAPGFSKGMASRQKWAGRDGQSPMLSDGRNGSHFGVSTQMIFEDGGSIQNTLGEIKRETGTFSAFNTHQRVGRQQSNPNDYKQRQGHNFIKQFNRQLTTNDADTRDYAGDDYREKNGPINFRNRGQRASMVSENADLNDHKARNDKLYQPIEQVACSAEHLNKLQFEMTDSNRGYYDHLSDLKKAEHAMDNVKAARIDTAVLSSIEDKPSLGYGSSNMPSQPLNVVLPANVQTGFTTYKQPALKPKQDYQQRRKPRAKTAVQRRAKRYAKGMKDLTGDQLLDSRTVVMNEKKLAVAQCTTTKGVVSLYNKGFVPKKTGKVDKRSKFFISGTHLYQTELEQKRAQEAAQANRQLEVGQTRELAENEDLEGQSRVVDQTFYPQDDGNFEIESGFASFNRVKLELRQKARDRAREAAIHDSIVAQKLSNEPRDSFGTFTGNQFGTENTFQTGKQHVFNHAMGSSDESMPDSNSGDAKKSLGASEIVLQSARGGSNRNNIIDYGSRDIVQDMGPDFVKKLIDTQVQKQSEGAAQKSNATPGINPEVGSTAGQNLTNAEHESREMTEGEENVMQPIMQERALSVDQQQRDRPPTGQKTPWLVPEDKVQQSPSAADKKAHRDLLPPKPESFPSRVKSAHRKSLPSRQHLAKGSSSGVIQPRRSHDRAIEVVQQKLSRAGTGEILKNTRSKSKFSSKEALNTDLGVLAAHNVKSQDASPRRNQRSKFMYSSALHEPKNIAKARSSVIQSKAVQRTNQTSMSQMPMMGASLQTRPLIGSQMLKNIAAKHGGKLLMESAGSMQAHLSSDNIQKNKQQIHLEIDNLQPRDEKTNESDKKVTIHQQPDSANSADGILGDKVTPKQQRSGRNRTSSARKDFTIEQGQTTSLGLEKVRCKVVLVSEQELQQALTIDKLAQRTPCLVFTPSGEIVRPGSGRNTSMPNKSGISSRTQQIDAQGRVKHVFLINQPSFNDIHKSSADKLTSGRRKIQERRRRRRKRPSSSRLKRRGHKFKLNSNESTCEDIATVRGGSTCREQHNSYDELPQRRTSLQQVTSLDIRKIKKPLAMTIKTDSNRSIENNMASSVSGEDKKESKNGTSHVDIQTLTERNLNQSGSVLVSRVSIAQQKYFSLEAGKINGLHQDGPSIRLTRPQYESIINQGMIARNVRASAAHSINDYLRHEEMSKIRVSDLQSTEFQAQPAAALDNDEVLNKTALQVVSTPNTQSVAGLRPQHPTSINGDDLNKVDITSGQPTTNLVRNAKYSQLSLLNGTKSIDTSMMLTDPNYNSIGQQTPTIAGRTADNQVIFVASSSNDRQKEGQMMVVTTIRSKQTRENKTPSATIPEEFRVSIDAKGDQNIEVLSQERGATGQRDSKVTDAHARNPHYMSSYTRGSQFSGDQAIMHKRYTPENAIEDQTEPQLLSSSGGVRSATEGIFLKTPQTVDSGVQSPAESEDPFSLSASIKQNQKMLELFQMQANSSLHNKLVKQDEALRRKERSVIPTKVATMPEKTQFQRRLFKEQRNPELAIVGFQKNDVTDHQLKGHIEKARQFYQSFQEQQIAEQMNEFQASAPPHAQHSIVDATGTLLIQDNDNSQEPTRRSERIIAQEENVREFADKGQGYTGREELTSFSAQSAHGLVQMMEQPRRLTGNNNNVITETFQKYPSTQYHGAYENESPGDVQSTEYQRANGSDMRAITPYLNVSSGQAEMRGRVQTPSTEQRVDIGQSQDQAFFLNNNIRQGPINRGSLTVETQQDHWKPNENTPFVYTEDNTEMDISPYEVLKNRPKLQQSDDRSMAKIGQFQGDLSNGKSEHLVLSAELSKSRRTSSRMEIHRKGEDLVEMAGEKITTADHNHSRPAEVSLSGKLSRTKMHAKTSSFAMQEVDRKIQEKVHKSAKGEEDDPQVNTIGVNCDIETVQSDLRDHQNQTILLQSAAQKEANKNQTTLIQTSASNSQKRLEFDNNLVQAADPPNFNVKVKVGPHPSPGQLASRRKDHQGAPPNYFMRKKGSDVSDTSETSRIVLTSQGTGTLKSKRNTQGVDNTSGGATANSAGISLAVETRNTLTGMRKKIVKSAVHSPEPDRTSEQTQTEHVTGHRDQHTLTINQYDMSIKLPSETSQAILRPRGGIGYQQEGKVTSHNSIQVTVGRVITPPKDRALANTAILNQDSNATLANLEADRKVEASKCRVFEDLGSALFTVGQKSLHQLGVRSEMTQQQTFSNIRAAEEYRQSIIKNRQKVESVEAKKPKKPQAKSKKMVRSSPNVNKTLMREVHDLTGGILGQAQCKPAKNRTLAKKQRIHEKQDFMRDTLQASQQLMDYSTGPQSFQPLSNASVNKLLQQSNSGIFDLQSHEFASQLQHNYRIDQREQPDLSKKSTITNMMAKRQKESSNLSNVPLPTVGITNNMPLISFGDLNIHSALNSKSPSNNHLIPSVPDSATPSSNRINRQNHTTLSGLVDFETQMERAEKLKNNIRASEQTQVRASSYSTQNSVKGIGFKSATNQSFKQMAKPARPISSGIYMRGKRLDNITPSLGVLNDKGIVQRADQNGFSGLLNNQANSRPLTAQQRGALQSAKSKPSLAKGSSGQNWGIHVHMTQGGQSETQASSVLQRRVTSGAPAAQEYQKMNLYCQKMEGRGHSTNVRHGVTNLISRNMYATTQQGTGSQRAMVRQQPDTVSPSFSQLQNYQNEANQTSVKRTRPFSGAQTLNTQTSLVGYSGKPPVAAISKSLNKNQMQRMNQQHHIAQR